MDPRDLIGDWEMELREFSVVDGPEGLMVKFPEAPGGFEGHLVQAGRDRWRIEGGPFPGAEIVGDGRGGWALGGYVPFARLDRPARAAMGAGVTPPQLELESVERDSFPRLWSRIDHPSHHPVVELGDHAPHRFVQWLMESDQVIFHGSNRLDLEEVTPVRESRERFEEVEQGNLDAVYGSHDGLWAMFLAVVDRSRLVGSIRNGVDRFMGADGSRLDMYHFSVPSRSLAEGCFTTGALYLLPRQRFSCLPLYPGGPSGVEWACPHPVRPLARLRVTPEDFPFLDQVGAHDD